MTEAQAPTLDAISVVMFTVADQDAALEFYTRKLGFELRAPGAPVLFMLRDPDGNTVTVVERSR